MTYLRVCILLLLQSTAICFTYPISVPLHDAISRVPLKSKSARTFNYKMQTDPVDPFDVPRPDPSILISAKPPEEQKLWIAGISGSLLVSTSILVAIVSSIENVLPSGWFGFFGNSTAVLFGLIFAAIGAAHFAKKETFINIVPPPGTWGGLWQIPAPGAAELGLSYEEYHTYWSGTAEILGGLLLAASGVGLLPEPLQQFDAFLMLVLTVAATPANMYMATHDAQMVGTPPMVYPDAHIFRGVIQAVIFTSFWKLAFH